MGHQPPRSQQGLYLLEMVVAIGLSGIFVLLISGMLSENLSLVTASQNQLIAGSAAELLIENAKATPYVNLLGFISSSPSSTLVVNLDQQGQPLPTVRQLPVQLDLVSNSNVYGSVNPFSGQIDSTAQWNQSVGNYFRGLATETFSDATALTGVPSVLITVTVSYSGISSQGNSSTPYTKTLTRTAIVFRDGASFQ